ncbi:MAG: restriction endonuclease subunit S [Lysobacterales bacterium]|nr:restriction endonuclease subunit S [Xanthomonadales bacterium]MCP5474107.1 restriction endonuclease subunit S [Rhodanobacteraceae bacterium]
MAADGWLQSPFAEVIDFQEGPGILAKDFRDHGVPLVRLAGLGAGKSVLAGCNYLDPETVARKWSHFALQEGDILLSTSASLGRVTTVGADGVGAIAYTGIIRMRPRDHRVVAPFIRYLLAGPEFQRQVEAAGVGSVIKHFGPMHLRRMSVQLPPPNEQSDIAHILGTLDDKIELNRRMNETLEAIARAIFKSWFVDFDPVRAKASGEPPESVCRRLGLTPDLLALFPDRLVDSELGEIPEGWAVKSLDEIANYLNGLALQKYPPESEIEWLPVIKIAQLKSGSSVGADRASHRLDPDYVVDDGDVLFSWSGSLEVDVWCGGRGALNQHLFKVTSKSFPKWFFFHWTREHLAHFRTIAAGKAVTMGHIQRKHLTEALCVVPSGALIKAADNIVAPMLQTVIENRRQARTLAATRDTLLPKLLSGELHVPLDGAA